MGDRLRAAVPIAALALSACAAGTIEDDGGGGAIDDAATSSTSGASTSASTGSGTGGGASWQGLPWSAEACSEPTQFVYVVSEEADIYRYWPPTSEFTKVGHVQCPGIDYFEPFSMAIDRHAIAWVETYGQKLYEIDLSNGECTQTSYAVPDGELHFPRFGMAFAKTPTPEEETLFVRGIYFTGEGPPDAQDTRWLGHLDLTNMTIVPIGAGTGEDSDLTSSDGHLFAIQRPLDTWANILEMDTATGTPAGAAEVPGVELSFDFAMAAWGGDFWIFSDGAMTGTVVHRYRPSTGMTTWAPGSPFPARIVGAGVSTCAPTTPPS